MKTTTRRLTIGLAAAVLAGGTVTTGAFAHSTTSTTAKVVTRHPSPTPAVTGVRWASHTGYDRVVFDIDGGAPGYDVRYVTSPATCAKGDAVNLGTARYLQVKLTPATAHSLSNTTRSPYLPTLKKLRKTCDFEADVTYVLGLDHKAGFHVTTLTGGTRIYVDIAH